VLLNILNFIIKMKQRREIVHSPPARLLALCSQSQTSKMHCKHNLVLRAIDRRKGGVLSTLSLSAAPGQRRGTSSGTPPQALQSICSPGEWGTRMLSAS
jgi:hypothetical protein